MRGRKENLMLRHRSYERKKRTLQDIFRQGCPVQSGYGTVLILSNKCMELCSEERFGVEESFSLQQ